MRRLGIYGGTFNPPHKGHICAVNEAIAGMDLGLVIVIPALDPPHKKLPEQVPTPEERFEMARLAFGDIKNVIVSDMEISRDRISFTVDTLRELRLSYPHDEFWLIVGSDMFLTLHTWRSAEEIFSMCGICALSRESGNDADLRDQAAFLHDRYGAVSRIMENRIVELSSTDVRKAVGDGEASDMVPGCVLEYIKDHGLYENSLRT